MRLVVKYIHGAYHFLDENKEIVFWGELGDGIMLGAVRKSFVDYRAKKQIAKIEYHSNIFLLRFYYKIQFHSEKLIMKVKFRESLIDRVGNQYSLYYHGAFRTIYENGVQIGYVEFRTIRVVNGEVFTVVLNNDCDIPFVCCCVFASYCDFGDFLQSNVYLGGNQGKKKFDKDWVPR
jgi:hypothetical protein